MTIIKNQLDDLFQKYKRRIDALNISTSDKERIYNNMFNEVQFKLVKSFFETLTFEQKKSIAEANTDEEALRTYFNLINESVEIAEFSQFIEQVYTEAMMCAISELPDLPISENNSKNPQRSSIHMETKPSKTENPQTTNIPA